MTKPSKGKIYPKSVFPSIHPSYSFRSSLSILIILLDTGTKLQLRPRSHNHHHHLSRYSPPTKRKPKFNAITCLICGKIAVGSEQDLNEHVSRCLSQSLWDKSDTTETVPFDQLEEEYDWNGETRIRLCSLECYRNKNRVKEECNFANELNVIEDETCYYGPVQYTESDLEGDYHNTGSMEESCSVENSSDNSRQDENDSACRNNSNSLNSESQNSQTLLINALKMQLKESQELSKNVPKCLLCQENYKNPCVSVGCWHVNCEQCWLLALGAKKTCPQCTAITRPSDLRRIYL